MHEIKFDGYRIQAQLDRGKVKLFTRKGLDWTEKFPTIAAAISKLRAKSAVFDGELVAEDSQWHFELFFAAAGSQGRSS